MQQAWIYLVLFFAGAIICDACFNIIYMFNFFGNDYDSISCRIVYGFHFMALVMCFMGLMEAYLLAVENLGWKIHGAKVDLSYFTALKKEFIHALKKLKAIVKKPFYTFTRQR
jgi:hypothetical protein